jgi:Domain of unknown function (DUF4396)
MSADTVLTIWFALTALSVLFIAWDLIFRTPEMKVMKAGWILVALYLGPIAFVVYWLSCREPSPETHEQFVAPLWKQTVGSTIHCLAGDATGVIASAAFVNRMRLPMAVDSAVEYVIGFAFGLFIFQALFMRDMLGGSYSRAVRATIFPEWLSMNAVMSGMVPVMTILMSRDMGAMMATSPRFWGVMSLATLAGALLALPVNWWLVAKKLKHGMGTQRALGKGGAPAVVQPMSGMATPSSPPLASSDSGAGSSITHPIVPRRQKFVAAALTLVMLGIGVTVAARAGAFAPAAQQPHPGMEMGVSSR